MISSENRFPLFGIMLCRSFGGERVRPRLPVGDDLRPGLRLPTPRLAAAARSFADEPQKFRAWNQTKAHGERRARRILAVVQHESPAREVPVQHRESELRGVVLVR